MPRGSPKNLSKQRFGKLVVLERSEPYICPKGRKRTRWKCLCDCGNISIAQTSKLTTGNTKSCGCGKIGNNFKHGLRNTRLYRIWANMKTRCYNTNDNHYERWGGRGITMCDEWKNNFKPFYDWAMTNGYSDDLSIDRVDNNGNYEPNNCRWATVKEQNNNKRNVKKKKGGDFMKLYSYQQEALNITKKINKVAYYMDMGLG